MHLSPNFHNIYFARTSTNKAMFLWVSLRCCHISNSVMFSGKVLLDQRPNL